MINNHKDVLQEWMQAVNEGDLAGLLALYDEKAVLIPTFSNRILALPKKSENISINCAFVRILA